MESKKSGARGKNILHARAAPQKSNLTRTDRDEAERLIGIADVANTDFDGGKLRVTTKILAKLLLQQERDELPAIQFHSKPASSPHPRPETLLEFPPGRSMLGLINAKRTSHMAEF